MLLQLYRIREPIESTGYVDPQSRVSRVSKPKESSEVQEIFPKVLSYSAPVREAVHSQAEPHCCFFFVERLVCLGGPYPARGANIKVVKNSKFVEKRFFVAKPKREWYQNERRSEARLVSHRKTRESIELREKNPTEKA